MATVQFLYDGVRAITAGGIYSSERVRNTAILLLVAALTGTPAAVLTCEWLCASEGSSPAAGHCHGNDTTDVRIASSDGGCSHSGPATPLAAIKAAAGGPAGITSPGSVAVITSHAEPPHGAAARHGERPLGPHSPVLQTFLPALRI